MQMILDAQLSRSLHFLSDIRERAYIMADIDNLEFGSSYFKRQGGLMLIDKVLDIGLNGLANTVSQLVPVEFNITTEEWVHLLLFFS
jgi:hypothetical protein